MVGGNKFFPQYPETQQASVCIRYLRQHREYLKFPSYTLIPRNCFSVVSPNKNAEPPTAKYVVMKAAHPMLRVYTHSRKRKVKLTRLRLSPSDMKTIMSAVAIKVSPLAGTVILLDLLVTTGLTCVLLGFGVAAGGVWLTKDVMEPVPVP